ncbi:DUF177 domain-containing protein [Azohydromonas sp. G-1-1-14]|uniref:Large ribosomal RNA subunit accumulation protein YceD n=2 Tax=Azohydromonas caseinilytica TaxID=2728836 RepID=A0A848F655_9BURK|nr:DUF177 domain-containing protein [Azohydromonas caseinilytica]
MKARPHDPLRLDIESFAADGAELQGRWPLTQFERLLDGWPAEAPPPGADVEWSASGELRRPKALEPERWLHLEAHTQVWRECQRCLKPVPLPLLLQRSLRFVRGEEEAARLDAESEEDVLALERSFNLQALVEDELLLALPLVPRHEQCPQPLTVLGEPDDDEAPVRENPFAALARLRRRPDGQGGNDA